MNCSAAATASTRSLGVLRRSAGVLATVGVVSALGASGLWACNRNSGSKFDATTLALVNGEAITRADFQSELQEDMRSPEGQPPSPEQVERVKRALLDSLVDRRLLMQAAREAELTVAPEEVDRRVMRMTGDYPSGDFEAALAQGRTTLSELKAKTQELLYVEKLFSDEVYPRVAVTEAQIREAFEKNREAYARPEQVRAAQIVVRTPDEAKRMQGLLAKGEKFQDLARKYSLSADAKVGGDLGLFERGVMPPAFDAVCFKLSVNQVSDVVESEYGFHLFKLLEKKAKQERDLSEVRAEVETALLRAERAKAETEYIASLRKKASLSINDEALAAITAAARPVRDSHPE